MLLIGCSGSKASAGNPGGSAGSGGTSGTNAKSLIGTWDLTTTPIGGVPVTTTLVIGQDSLEITSPAFTLTAQRTGNALTFTDEQTVGNPSANVALTATQTASAFKTGIVPFALGGSWTMKIVPAGGSTVMTCTLSVSASKIDGACQKVTSDGFDFSFTTAKQSSAASSFGDFGGKWLNTWTWPGASGGTYPCQLDFAGNKITTCPGGALTGGSMGTPLSGITFNYDGANTVSGVVQGWAEYSATRQ